jgi:hypothetical protein
LGLSQRVDTNGKPDSGWLLYLYDANTSTPVTAYKDTGLTTGLELPWPIEADSAGTMPAFWLADGSYRVRGISADGSRTFFDMPSVLAIGPSSGSGGGGGVDSTTIFQTGDLLFNAISGTRSGWVRHNGRTIGSASSGATERANADCNALYLYLWNNFADAKCPVPGGRGANAASDWSANKQITLLDLRGVGPIGLDDMGNSAAGNFTGVPFGDGSATTAGAICGENTHTLVTSETPSHTHTASVSDPGHSHNTRMSSSNPGLAFGAGRWFGAFNNVFSSTTDTDMGATATTGTGISVSNANSGGDGAHNTVSRSIVGTWYVKL